MPKPPVPRSAAWRAATWAVLLGGLALVVAGIALIYAPAGLIAGGIAVIGVATFDPSYARKLTWPR